MSNWKLDDNNNLSINSVPVGEPEQVATTIYDQENAFTHTYRTGPVPQTRQYMMNHQRLVKELLPKNPNAGLGFSEKVIKDYNLGVDPCFTEGLPPGMSADAFIIPIDDYSFIAACYSDIKDKFDFIYIPINTGPNAERPMFNEKVLYGDQPVFIVGNALDALSIITAGGQAIALNDLTNWRKLANMIKDNPEKKPIAPLILALPNTKNAQEHFTEEFSKWLDTTPVYFAKPDVSKVYGENKSSFDAFSNDPVNFKNWVSIMQLDARAQQSIEKQEDEKKKRDYVNKTGGVTADLFTHIDQLDAPGVATGFNQLDTFLEGGLFPGLYTIGASPSIGKTTFVLQMADNIAKQGRDILYFSLEMARKELVAKSISRETFMLDTTRNEESEIATTTRGIMLRHRRENILRYKDKKISNEKDGDGISQNDAINIAIKNYQEYGNRVYIQEGMGDIGLPQLQTMIETHHRYTGNWPVVIIDYAQILAPYDPKLNDKQNTDKTVMELKRMSRDFGIPVIIISSFNRVGYLNSVSMESFKESGALEYGSDVLIGLQPHIKESVLEGNKDGEKRKALNEAKEKLKRQVELVILKNRNGPTGKTINFYYYTLFNFLEETKDKFTD